MSESRYTSRAAISEAQRAISLDLANVPSDLPTIGDLAATSSSLVTLVAMLGVHVKKMRGDLAEYRSVEMERVGPESEEIAKVDHSIYKIDQLAFALVQAMGNSQAWAVSIQDIVRD